MFGGADPAIPNLVADGITFRRNLVSRPMSWRDPIISDAAERPSGTSTAGGALRARQLCVSHRRPRGVGQGTIGRSTASAEVTVHGDRAGERGAAHVATRCRCDRVPGLRPHRRRAGDVLDRHRHRVRDTGSAGTAGAVPTSPGTVWTVKNLFELKNARNVRRRGQHLREPLEGSAARVRDCPHAAQLERRLRLVRGRARALRVQPGAKRCRRHQPARLRQRQSVPAGGRHRVP